MMQLIRAGTRLHSAVDDTEVVVVRAPKTPVSLGCGGHPMLPMDEHAPPGLEIDPALAGGSQLGKRFADETSGIELLCTKAGAGTLTVDGETVPVKAAKLLPASD
jgi:hypothetical protein